MRNKKAPFGAFLLHYLLSNSCEYLRILSGERCEDLAVEHDAPLLKLRDEGAVGLVAIVPDCRVEADNPECADIILLVAAVGKSLLSSVNKRFLGSALLLRAAMTIPLGALKNVLAALKAGDSSFYSWHILKITGYSCLATLGGSGDEGQFPS